ncbi:MAG: hypothetical protein ISS33_00020 [Candidatus Omnitrophica bacterium]|nr:hypothetical protein [Candidatus Omnitrophota bacterium]
MNRETKINEEDFCLESLSHQAKLLFTSFKVRIFILCVGLVFLNIIKMVIGVNIPFRVLLIFGVWLGTCLLYLIPFRPGFCKTRKALDNIHFSYYFFGIIYATLAIHYLGGAEGVVFFIYLFDLVYANVLMRRSRGISVSALIFISYFSLLILEYRGIIPHYRLFQPTDAVYDNFQYLISSNIIAVGALFFLMSYSTGLFFKIKEDRENRLTESKNRFAAKSVRLEENTRLLRKKIAENIYLKRAAMGYVEKKEFELVKTKRALEEKIEKLKNTQNTMFTMIQDMNDISRQLKNTRDNLETKVKDRTDELLLISRRLHKSEKIAFLGKLAGSVTHELRNPLAVLKNAAYFMGTVFKGKKIDKKKMIKYVDIMQKEISIIDSIIDDIMGFAKTNPPVFKKNSIKSIIEQAISSIRIPEFVTVKKEFKKCPKIMVDSDQLAHALQNIANNAIMAMSGSGELTFRLQKKDDCVCIEIEDTGGGIPPDQMPLIFEPLYSSKPKGTGLGLPIAKIMIESQEGRIDFESELGEGTVFKICLPINGKGRD